MKNFIYLVQGAAELIPKYYYLLQRPDIKVLFLTYDTEIRGAFFLPCSTWAQGRNFLLDKALSLNETFLYYIFLDDDITFLRGSFLEFEKNLFKYRPAVGVPVFIPKTQSTVFSKNPFIHFPCTFQICQHADAQFLALHIDLIKDQLAVPLQTHFDSTSWWCTSSTQQLLLFNLYGKKFLQFNLIEISNDFHREYINKEFKDKQHEWFKKEFKKETYDPRLFALNLFSFKNLRSVLANNKPKHAIRYFINFFNVILHSIFYHHNKSYSFSENKIRKKLNSNSSILNQYLLAKMK